MRNRAKCRLCNEIIESFHRHDYVTCKCGEISIDGGNDHFRSGAMDYKNFLRVDDLGNEIVVSFKKEDEVAIPIDELSDSSKPTKKELLDMLDHTIKSIEGLPANAMSQPISHYDFCSALLLLSSILRCD